MDLLPSFHKGHLFGWSQLFAVVNSIFRELRHRLDLRFGSIYDETFIAKESIIIHSFYT